MAQPPSRNAASSLPAELMSLVYAPLSQPDLLAAAAVSSWWRTNAVRDPNYYRAWKLVFPRAERLSPLLSSDHADPDKFISIVKDSEFHKYTLGLSIFIDLEDLPSDDSDNEKSSLDSFTPHPIADDVEGRLERNKTEFQTVVLPALLRALPRVVVLNLYPCLDSLHILWEGLSSPAPVLRALELRAGMYDPLEEPEIPPLPAHFLAGSAPHLAEVYLITAVMSPSTPIFPSVRRLQLACPFASPAFDTVFTCFPNIRELEIECLPDGCDVSPDECALFSQLQTLRLGPHNVAELMRALPSSIPVPFIEYSSIPVYRALALLNVGGPLSVRLYEHPREVDAEPLITEPHRFTQLCLEITAPGAVRRIDSNASFQATIEILNIAHCAERITQLTIDDRQVRALIRICGSMPALCTLQIVLVTWHTLRPDAQLTEDESTLYQEPHVRNDCQCLGGPFSDWYDGGAPDGTCCASWAALETVELCASRADSMVPAAVLRGLAEALTLAPDRPLKLVLSNGLSLADDARDTELAALFSEIRCPDDTFCASLPCVARTAALLVVAARKKDESRKKMNMMLRFNGPDFHWEECDEANSKDTSEEEPETGSQSE